MPREEISREWEPAFSRQVEEELSSAETTPLKPPAGAKGGAGKSDLLFLQVILCGVLLLGAALLCRVGMEQPLAQFYRTYLDTGLQLPIGQEAVRFANAKVAELRGGIAGLIEKLEQEEEEPASAGGSSAPQGMGNAQATAYTADGQAVMPSNATLAQYRLSETPLMPVQGRLTSGFGFRENPVGEGEDFHTGIDLAAPENTPARAAYAGVVEKTGHSPISGNYVTLRHGRNVRTTYCHLKKIYVLEGQSISQGQSIGCVGLTGMTTGYHLHFEISIDGTRVDPRAAWEGLL